MGVCARHGLQWLADPAALGLEEKLTLAVMAMLGLTLLVLRSCAPHQLRPAFRRVWRNPLGRLQSHRVQVRELREQLARIPSSPAAAETSATRENVDDAVGTAPAPVAS